MKKLELLNKFQTVVIAYANDNNISLQAEFGSVEKFKDFVVALLFKMLIDMGKSTAEAYDLIFGDGEFNKLADDVWNRLNPAEVA